MKNSDKYGDKKDDIISQAFNDRYEYGVGFCKWNIKKYLKRIKSIDNMPKEKQIEYQEKEKGGILDGMKAKDYLNRWEKETRTVKDYAEFIQFKNEIGL